MLLIDSLYINSSGGLRLLEYLVYQLSLHNVSFHLLADSRCQGYFDQLQSVEYLNATMMNRRFWYSRTDLSHYSSVLCFGNIPTPFKIEIPVYTYFHNINLLTLNELPSFVETIKGWLKRRIYRHYKNNTDYWLVQTMNTQNELLKHLGERQDRVKLLPFYNIPFELTEMAFETHGVDYVYVANYTGSKQHEELLEAWKILHEQGIDKTLHLTVPDTATLFLQKIRNAQKLGVQIVNHGFLPFDQVIKLYSMSKAIVYPSLNESLGLGIVEAITSGCDVIGADLPYTHAICKPSCLFNPYSADSIARAVIEYEKGDVPKSELLVRNRIDDLIDLLIK